MSSGINTDLISDYINKNHSTISKFCKECDISTSTYYRIMHGKDISLVTFARIAKHMNLSFLQLYNLEDSNNDKCAT